jgi:hypothetical protein
MHAVCLSSMGLIDAVSRKYQLHADGHLSHKLQPNAERQRTFFFCILLSSLHSLLVKVLKIFDPC